MVSPASWSRRTIWLRVRTLASTMISSRLLGDLLLLGGHLLALGLAGLDLRGRGQAAAEDRLLEVRFVEPGEAPRDPCRMYCSRPEWP